ncbi:pyrroline-5-carboxylate reductase [Thalassotalea aquiviva]|uniref:pyrroline-5-carboxylate reductase n=1 Tax=Thalassotalea aquiviva TaxID=3242415 RepID=UPI00352A0576
MKIAFIGGGNMAKAMLKGLLKSGLAPQNIMVCAPTQATRTALSNEFNIKVAEQNSQAVDFADVIIIAVKPYLVVQVSKELNDVIKHQQQSKLVVSVAAGIGVDALETALAPPAKVVAAMPNLPTALGRGVTGLVASSRLDGQEKETCESLFGLLGKAVWLNDESQMPALVATAGSAPAYFFLFLEGMVESGVNLGLSKEDAKQAALQTGLGSMMMAMESEHSLTELRQQVTSPNGTTEQAILSFQQDGLSHLVDKAMQAAANKAKGL